MEWKNTDFPHFPRSFAVYPFHFRTLPPGFPLPSAVEVPFPHHSAFYLFIFPSFPQDSALYSSKIDEFLLEWPIETVLHHFPHLPHFTSFDSNLPHAPLHFKHENYMKFEWKWPVDGVRRKDNKVSLFSTLIRSLLTSFSNPILTFPHFNRLIFELKYIKCFSIVFHTHPHFTNVNFHPFPHDSAFYPLKLGIEL